MGRPRVAWGADSAGNPDPAALAAAGIPAIGRYLSTPYQRYGVTRGYIDDCHAAGVGVFLIFEEWASQFLGGYPAAVAACARGMEAWHALGAPLDGSVVPHVALVDPTPSAVYGAEGVLQAYAKGWDDTLPFPRWRGYGSRYGLDLAAQVVTKMELPWGVGTWGYGEAGDGSLPDWTGDVTDLIQHGNLPGLVPGTDTNTLYRADLGAWGGPAPAPVPAPLEEGVMERLVKNDDLPAATETAGNGWWYFPPTGLPWQVDSGVTVLSIAATGVPSFHTRGPQIVAAIDARQRAYPATAPGIDPSAVATAVGAELARRLQS